MKDYQGWTLSALKAELKKRGAKLSGRKEELVERLESYDRNENFGNIPDAACNSWSMAVPEETLYKDLTTNTFMPLNKQATDTYLSTHEVILGEKSRRLYEERFLRYAKTCTQKDHVFIKLQCRAEMKRSVTYDMNIQIEMDGSIVACQCDCTAGMGPGAHCKHIRTALYGLLQFSMNKPLIVQLTCTERLQRFHRPKTTHSTSPVKSQNLGLLKDVKNVLFDPLSDIEDETDVEYRARFRSVIINDCVNRRETSALMHLFSPANPYALNLDHDYLPQQTSDIFLDRENITKISMDLIEEVELCTRGQAKNPRWKTERMKRIQSSNFGEVAKATERRDLNKLAMELMSAKDLSHVQAVRHGILHEDTAIQKYEEMTSRTVTRMGLIIDEERPYLGTSVDGLSDEIVVEVKCPFASRGKPVNHVSVPYLKRNSDGLSLNEKHDYYFQIQGQLHITKKSMCHLVIYTVEDLKIIKVPRDEPFITDMLEKLDNFFLNHFKPAYLQKHFYKHYYEYHWDYEMLLYNRLVPVEL